MDWLGILNALPRAYSKELLAKIAALRDAAGGADSGKLQELYDLVAANSEVTIRPEDITSGVKELFAVLFHGKSGPPNPGAGAVAFRPPDVESGGSA